MKRLVRIKKSGPDMSEVHVPQAPSKAKVARGIFRRLKKVKKSEVTYP